MVRVNFGISTIQNFYAKFPISMSDPLCGTFIPSNINN